MHIRISTHNIDEKLTKVEIRIVKDEMIYDKVVDNDDVLALILYYVNKYKSNYKVEIDDELLEKFPMLKEV